MKKENTTFIPPTSPIPNEEMAQNERKPEKRKSSSTQAQRKNAADKPAAKKAVRPTRPRTVNRVPLTTFEEDENLEEVLDEPLESANSIEELPFEEPEEITPPPRKLSIFQRRQQQKQKQAEEKLSALDLIRKKSGLTEDDIILMFELGYENELGRLVGYENLKRLKTDYMRHAGMEDKHLYRTAFGYRGQEFVSNTHKDAVLGAYVHDRKQLLVRLLLTALCTLLLFFTDQPAYLGVLASYLPFSELRFFDLLGALLMIPVVALSFRQINAGARALAKFSPNPYSVPAVLVPLLFAYDAAVIWLQADMLRVNFLVAAILLLMTLADALRLAGEMRTLRLLAVEEIKHVLVPATPRKKKLRHGNKIVKIINDDLGENLYQARTGVQTVGFFRRFNSMESAARPLAILLVCSLSFSVLSGFFAAVYTGTLAAGLSAFMTVLLLCIPVTAAFGYFYPLCRANRVLARKNCALVGEEAVDELDCDKTVIFQDTDLYSAEKCTEIAVKEGDDFRGDMRIAGALFRKLGGTLETVGNAAPPMREVASVSILRMQEYGVEAMVDTHHVLAGSAEFLRHGGVRVPRESSDKTLRRGENVGLMYVAIDGVLKLSYEIEYQTKPSFEKLVQDLSDHSIDVAVSSYDPNLNESFMQKSRSASQTPVHVVKPGRFEEEKPLEIADTGVVALGKKTDLVYPLYAAQGVGQMHRFCNRIQLIASILGALAVILLTIFNPGATLGISAILAYQGFWLVVFLLSAQAELSDSRFGFHR